MKFYTVKEIADILGVSKTTVQKAIKAAAIEFDKVEKNRQYYSFEKDSWSIDRAKDYDYFGEALENLNSRVQLYLDEQ